MAEFKTVLKEQERMCKHFRTNSSCASCPLSSANNPWQLSCDVLHNYNKEERVDYIENAVMGWVKQHPFVTNADKFKEIFGVAIWEPGVSSCIGFNCPVVYKDGGCSSLCQYCDFWEREYKGDK